MPAHSIERDHRRPLGSAERERAFSLIWVSILLTVGAVIMVSVLPGREAGDYNEKILKDVDKLDRIEEAMRGFMVFNGRRPCPADGQYALNTPNFGKEAANPGTCTGGTPAAPMGPDAGTGYIVGGVIPTQSLNLPDSYAFDEFGRRFTYVVDKRATKTSTCRTIQNIPLNNGTGGLQINDTNAAGTKIENVMYAYISHGPDGYGAFPASGSTVANRFNSGSTNAASQINAGVNSSFTYNTTNFTSVKIQRDRVLPAAGDTGFDDLVYYRDDLKNTCCLGSKCVPKGFIINASQANEYLSANSNFTSQSMVVGDVNGDGIADLVIGAPGKARVYVVFGTRHGFPDPLPLSSIDGTNGFVLTGPSDVFGTTVALADINQDGQTDIVIAGPSASNWIGAIYVVFGGSTQKNGTAWTSCTYASPCSVNAAFLNGGGTAVNGFELDGDPAESNAAGYVFTGVSLAVGDVNGDNITDIVIGAPAATTGGHNGAGAIYVVFGGATKKDGTAWAVSQTLNAALLNGTNGAEFDGGAADAGAGNYYAGVGNSVAVGDFTGDNIADILVGGGGGGFRYYAVFGYLGAWSGPPTVFTTGSGVSPLDGTHGFELTGGGGHQALIADLNADGIGDIFVASCCGQGDVLFGHSGAWAAAQPFAVHAPWTLSGSDGFVLLNSGIYQFNSTGPNVAAGDVNGDGVSDIIIGNYTAGSNNAGAAFVVFGTKCGGTWVTPCPATITNSAALLNGTTGAEFDGTSGTPYGDLAGTSVATGDINGDGIADLMVGGPYSSLSGAAYSGSVFVYFGHRQTPTNPWPTTPYNLGGL